ncbi:retrotransposon protein, putative, ty1-copia subclass [Tanacetum coccineum]
MVSSKWLFKIKEGIEGVQKPRYKARLVARGFTQRACIDYNKVFSLVVRHTSIRVILALTACKDYELEQLDVKTAFLHVNLEEVIYMKQPPGYEQDDMLIACKSKAEIGSTKSLLKKEFDMKELGEAKKILGMEIVRDRSRKILRVSQSGYVSKILNNFRIDNGKSVQMPLGGHFKLSLKDCPVRDCDVERADKVRMAKCDRGNHVDVTGFVDSDYAKDPDKGRSITGYAFLVQGCVVSWKATLQHVVALSTTEAEYMALTESLEAKTVKVLKVGTEHNAADALTKVVPGLKLHHCLELLRVGGGEGGDLYFILFNTNQSSIRDIPCVCLLCSSLSFLSTVVLCVLRDRGSASSNQGCRRSIPTRFLPFEPSFDESSAGARFGCNWHTKSRGAGHGVQKPTRVEVVTALIWKCAMAASKEACGYQNTSRLTHFVNLRKKLDSKMSKDFICNMIWISNAVCQASYETTLHGMVNKVRESISKVNVDFMNKAQGNEGYIAMQKSLQEMGEIGSVGPTNNYGFTSWCNMGFYDIDFGWGKPSWVTGFLGDGVPVFMNLVTLMDTKCGGGIEAWVNLDEQDMENLQGNQELLAYASLDPSPI